MTQDTQKQSRYSRPTIPRRTVLKGAAAAGLFATIPWGTGRVRALTGETPFDVPKWEDPLPRPGVMTPDDESGGVDYYEIEMTQFRQQVLPNSTRKRTTLWGYGGTYPAATIEARPGRPVEVKWINEDLPKKHLLSVDERVHGAGGDAPEVRTVVHLHGGVVPPEDDGYPEAWATPDGETTDDFESIRDNPVPYKQTKEYPNDQHPTTLWYHDHGLGITRLNVYAGLAGFYLLRDSLEEDLPSGEYEIPILVQDRSFRTNGDLFYPQGGGPYEAEFFGDVPVVNGKAYPFLEVEPRRYRFRFLNGSNGMTFNMNLYNEDTGSYDDVPLLHQIGVDQGFLRKVVTLGPGGDVPSLLLSGAERADVIVDFSEFEGQTFTVTNDAESPYTGANEGSHIPELLQIRVLDEGAADDSLPVDELDGFLRRVNRKYKDPKASGSGITRRMTLDSGEHEGLDTHFLNLSLWDDPDAVVSPTLDTWETWELFNTTGDSHPIHLHLVDFEVFNRQGFDAEGFLAARDAYLEGETDTEPDPGDYLADETVRKPTPNNRIKKDTVLVNPGEVVRIRPAFTGFTGHFVWHCHILEHEDQEMMLPYEVVE